MRSKGRSVRNGSSAERRTVGRMGDESMETRIGKRITVLANGCWLYGDDLGTYRNVQFTGQHHQRGNRIPAHRFVYEVLVGPIDDDHEIHHHCENPGCVNPKHLEPMSVSDHHKLHAEIRRGRVA